MLSSIAGSLITVTSLTFSLTVVALQLASSQASPRLLRMFASDRRVHATLAMFLGTFAFAMTVLRSVRSADETIVDDTGFVPRLAVSVTFVLMLAAVVTLTLFLAHLATRLRVETMLRDVHGETTRTVRALYSEEPPTADAHDLPAEPAERRLTLATRSGFLVGVDRTALRGIAVRDNLVISVDTAVGDDVVEGAPLASWCPRASRRVRAHLGAGCRLRYPAARRRGRQGALARRQRPDHRGARPRARVERRRRPGVAADPLDRGARRRRPHPSGGAAARPGGDARHRDLGTAPVRRGRPGGGAAPAPPAPRGGLAEHP